MPGDWCRFRTGGTPKEGWLLPAASVRSLRALIRRHGRRQAIALVRSGKAKLSAPPVVPTSANGQAATQRTAKESSPVNGSPATDTGPRVRCEQATHSVWLDGELIASAIRPKPFRFFKAIVEANGNEVRGDELRKLPGLAGAKLVRIKDQLHPALRLLVKSVPRAGGGYWLELPTKSCP
jgi:hypothetical protein